MGIGSGGIDGAGRRLYLPSGADSEGWNVLSLNSLPLSVVMWTTAPTLDSLRRAAMWASGVLGSPPYTFVLKGSHALRNTHKHTPAPFTHTVSTPPKRGSPVGCLFYVLSPVISVENLFLLVSS